MREIKNIGDVEVVGYPKGNTHHVKIYGLGEAFLPIIYYLWNWDDDGSSFPLDPILKGSLPDCFPDISSSTEWRPCKCGHHICFYEKVNTGNITGVTQEVVALPMGITIKP